MDKRMKEKKGFTLIEVVVVIAVVAILAAILTPSIFKYIDDARKARAKNEVIVLTSAFVSFYKDIGDRRGLFPDNGGIKDIVEILHTNGNPAAGEGNWGGGGAGSTTDLMYNHFYEDESGRYATAYPNMWKGPYCKKILDSDPWGNRYIIYFEDDPVRYCWCCCAGPDGTFQTDHTLGAIPLNSDDIGKMIARFE